MENNNISTSQGYWFYKMNNRNNRCNSKSSTIRTLQDEIFIPFENIGADAFINVLEDDVVYHMIDDHGSQ